MDVSEYVADGMAANTNLDGREGDCFRSCHARSLAGSGGLGRKQARQKHFSRRRRRLGLSSKRNGSRYRLYQAGAAKLAASEGQFLIHGGHQGSTKIRPDVLSKRKLALT